MVLLLRRPLGDEDLVVDHRVRERVVLLKPRADRRRVALLVDDLDLLRPVRPDGGLHLLVVADPGGDGALDVLRALDLLPGDEPHRRLLEVVGDDDRAGASASRAPRARCRGSPPRTRRRRPWTPPSPGRSRRARARRRPPSRRGPRRGPSRRRSATPSTRCGGTRPRRPSPWSSPPGPGRPEGHSPPGGRRARAPAREPDSRSDRIIVVSSIRRAVRRRPPFTAGSARAPVARHAHVPR